MNRKGISPLIATVLIIGFTIVLASLVMTWGQDLFKRTTEQTGESVTAQLTCMQEVDISLAGDCSSLTVNNDGNSEIINIIVRSGGTAKEFPASIQGYNSLTIDLSAEGYTDELEAIPIVKTDEIARLECPGKSKKLTC